MASAVPTPSRGMERYKGRVALVTGASTGIGAAICVELLQHGMIVVGCAREHEKIQAVADAHKAAPGELHAIKCDLSDKESIADMFKQIRSMWGKVDVCINNAGFGTDTPFMYGETEAWRKMLQVNVTALCICSRESIQLMKEKDIEDGLIIHVGCVMGHRVPEMHVKKSIPPNFGFYYGTKFMVRGLAESLRHELIRDGSKIRVALISPGAVKTEMYERGFSKAAAEEFYGTVHCLQPEDIAKTVRYIMRVPSNVNVQDIIVQPLQYSMTS